MRNLLKFLHLWIVVNLSPKNLIWRIKTTNYRRRLPALRDPFASSLLTGLKETGVVITHLDDLRANGIEVPDALIESALRLIEPLRQSDHLSPNLPYTLHGAQESLVTDFDMFTFALNPTLLSLVENYIGGNVHYRGCITRRDFADGREVETRLWHKDAADRRIIKVVIYCDDVTENDGPFSFIPRKKIAEHRIS